MLTPLSQLEEVLEWSKHDQQANGAGPSRLPDTNTASEPAWAQRQTLNRSLTSISIEINDIDQQIKDLKELRNLLVRKKADVESQLGDIKETQTCVKPVNKKGKGKRVQGGIDYTKEMDWSDALKARMKNVFGIDNFRLCQQGCVFHILHPHSSQRINSVLAFAMPTWTAVISSVSCPQARSSWCYR